MQPHPVGRGELDIPEREADAGGILGDLVRGVIDEARFHRFPASRGQAGDGHQCEQALHRADCSAVLHFAHAAGRRRSAPMLSREDNELLTRVDRGTPMGTTMRRYWIPALLAWELPAPDCPPVRVKLLGEELVAFRDTQDRIGLIDDYCPHRRTSLFFGRNEECGLRCVYHGWKFDVGGRCVDMMNEPEHLNFKEKISVTSYPTVESGGVIWAYLGPPELRPPLPTFAWAQAPATHRHVSKVIQETNWLQGLEGGVDTSHAPILHRVLKAK